MDNEGCEVKQFCKNNEIRCWYCKGDNAGSDMFYKPNDNPKAPKRHPIIEREKSEIKTKLKAEKAAKSAANKKEKSKQTLAAMMEQKAHKMADRVAKKKFEKDFSAPTLNSGRVTRDVDHTMHSGQIRLDSKHQSKRKHPLVNLDELDEAVFKGSKFRSDLAGLIIWNEDQRPVVVFDYEDWLRWEAERGTDIQENSQ